MMDRLAATLIVCKGTQDDPCTYAKLVLLAKNLITDLIIAATVLATLGFIYVGFTLLTSGGDEGKMRKAKDIFKKLVIGFVWVLAAWIVVYTITSTLLNDTSGSIIQNIR